MPHTTISCTAVLALRNRRPPLQSQTFLNIPIPDVLLARRGGVTSILIGSLLNVLQQQNLMENGVSDELARAIGGARPEVEMFKIATTRIPSFGNDMQDPVNGYRSLGMLSSVNAQMEFPSQATIQLGRELLAVQSDDPITKAFEHTWAPLGLKLETHFIIIFNQLSRDGSLFSLRDITSAPGSSQINSAPGSHQSSVGYQPVPSRLFSSPVNADWLRGLADASTDISRTNSPALGTAAQFVQSTAAQGVSNLVPGTPIEVVCRQHAISDGEMRSAMFLTTEKSLLSMVHNYRQMSHILSQLGLQQRDAAFIPSQAVLFPGGLVLSAGDVVKHFGWTAESFKHKSVWFGWAEDVAVSQEWNGSPPSERVVLLLPYICFLIFVFLFSFASCSTDSGQLQGVSGLAWNQVFLGTAGTCESGLFPRGGAE